MGKFKEVNELIRFELPTDEELDKMFIIEARKFFLLSDAEKIEFLGVGGIDSKEMKKILKRFKHNIKAKELQASNRLFNMRRNRSNMVKQCS